MLWWSHMRGAGSIDSARIVRRARTLEGFLFVLVGRERASGDPRILRKILIRRFRR